MREKYLNALAFFLFLGATLFYFRPLLEGPGCLLPDDNDSLIIAWSLNKPAQKGSIFYPYPFSSAYTDPFITDGLIGFPFVKFVNEPTAAYGANLLVSQVLLLFFTFLFLKQLSGGFAVSLLLSLAFGFSEARMHYLGHLQMFSLYWVPLIGYLLLKLAGSKKIIFLYLFYLAFLLQVLNSFLPGYFILFLGIGLVLIKKELREIREKNLKHVIVGGLLAGLVLFPLINKYLKMSAYFDYSRPVRDVIHFSLSPEEVITKFGSPAVLLAFIFSLVCFIVYRKKMKEAAGYLWLTFGALVMALGPALHFFGKTIKVFGLPIPLPYAVFYYLLPGFQGFRTPSRWIFLAGFLAVAFSAIILVNAFKKWPKAGKILILLAIFLLTMRSFLAPYKLFTVPCRSEYPAVYSWLRQQPGKVIMEIPLYYWRDGVLAKLESRRLLFGLTHQKNSVNGISGFTPPGFEQLAEYLKTFFPGIESMEKIKNLSVDYLVVHEDEFKERWPDSYRERLKLLKSAGLKTVYREGDVAVYEIK